MRAADALDRKESKTASSKAASAKVDEETLRREREHAAILDAIVAAAEKASPAKLLIEIVQELSANAECDLVAKRRALGAGNSEHKIKTFAEKQDAKTLAVLALELLASDEYGNRDEIARALGVDVKAVVKAASAPAEQAPAVKTERPKVVAKKKAATKTKKGGKKR